MPSWTFGWRRAPAPRAPRLYGAGVRERIERMVAPGVARDGSRHAVPVQPGCYGWAWSTVAGGRRRDVAAGHRSACGPGFLRRRPRPGRDPACADTHEQRHRPTAPERQYRGRRAVGRRGSSGSSSNHRGVHGDVRIGVDRTHRRQPPLDHRGRVLHEEERLRVAARRRDAAPLSRRGRCRHLPDPVPGRGDGRGVGGGALA